MIQQFGYNLQVKFGEQLCSTDRKENNIPKDYIQKLLDDGETIPEYAEKLISQINWYSYDRKMRIIYSEGRHKVIIVEKPEGFTWDTDLPF